MEAERERPSLAGFDYNIASSALINVIFGRAAALYTIRLHLTRLHEWSDEEHHLGYQFVAICGERHGALCGARSEHIAALELRAEILTRLTAMPLADLDQAELKDQLVVSLTRAGSTTVSEPFGPIFTYVADRAAAWFGDDWPDDVTIRIEALGGCPYPNSNFWINACTNLHFDEPVAAPTVHLRLKPERLNMETYAAIFAVLVHEFVCHVPGTARSSNSSPFAEGFCDWAAFQLFGRWLDNFDPQLRDAARRFGRQIWEVGMSKSGGNPNWTARCFGHEAAEHVADVFREAGPAATAVDETVKLARELTVLDASSNSKDNFVRSLAVIDAATRARLLGWRAGVATASDLLRMPPP